LRDQTDLRGGGECCQDEADSNETAQRHA